MFEGLSDLFSVIICRCSAVFGGIYCLKRSTQSIVMGSDARAVGVRTENQSLNSSFIVVEDSFIPKATIKSCVSRAILITDKYALNLQKNSSDFL